MSKLVTTDVHIQLYNFLVDVVSRNVFGVVVSASSTQGFNQVCFSIFDADACTERDSCFCKLLASYDNEWDDSHRVMDLAKILAVTI